MKRYYWIPIGTLILGMLLGFLFFGRGSEEGEKSKEGTSEKADQGQTYTCSMHPQVRKSEPGDCPICGMELIPVDDMANESETVLEMSENAIKIGEIQTREVKKAAPEKMVRMQGEIEVDERRISMISARFPGRIERLYVDFTGQKVQKGQKLASVYSPELIAAQRELFEAKQRKEEDPAFYQAAKSKLKLWDLSDADIQAIEESGSPQKVVDIRAPHSGIVTERKVSLGEYLQEGTELFKLADLSRIWVIFHAYGIDIPWIDVGDEVEFSVTGIPGKEFQSEVRFIHPRMKEGTRTVSVRAEAPNPNGQLRPGMFAKGVVDAELDFDEPRIVIPNSAVLWTGERSIAYVEVPDTERPTFELRQLELGADLGEAWIVEEGLEEGERVVSHGAFRVDAAAQLAGKKSMMQQMGSEEEKEDDQKGESSMSEMESSKTGSASSGKDEGGSPEGIRGLVEGYLELKNALVGSYSEDAAREAQKALSYLDQLEEGLDGNMRKEWESYGGSMRENLNKIEESSEDIEPQRKAFAELSSTLIEVVKRWAPDRKLYLVHCPMVNEGEGADWLSGFEEVRNPYYGEKMLNCGSVKDSLE